MGDLSVHVAKIARLRVPNVAVPVEVQPTVTRMAQVAEHMVEQLNAIITDRDVAAAIELGRDDEVMDGLRRTSFTELLSDDWTHGVEAAVDVALLGRYYERIADHAVSVANRVVFVVTGENPSALSASGVRVGLPRRGLVTDRSCYPSGRPNSLMDSRTVCYSADPATGLTPTRCAAQPGVHCGRGARAGRSPNRATVSSYSSRSRIRASARCGSQKSA